MARQVERIEQAGQVRVPVRDHGENEAPRGEGVERRHHVGVDGPGAGISEVPGETGERRLRHVSAVQGTAHPAEKGAPERRFTPHAPVSVGRALTPDVFPGPGERPRELLRRWGAAVGGELAGIDLLDRRIRMNERRPRVEEDGPDHARRSAVIPSDVEGSTLVVPA